MAIQIKAIVQCFNVALALLFQYFAKQNPQFLRNIEACWLWTSQTLCVELTKVPLLKEAQSVQVDLLL